MFARSVHFVARQYAGQVMAWSRLRQVWKGGQVLLTLLAINKLRLISRQMEENKKYELELNDASGETCHPELGTAITCAENMHCCTSKRSYFDGTPHDQQTKFPLYSICCPLDNHCSSAEWLLCLCACGSSNAV